jgi:Fe2+ or Zn2+ uptake regulation protein
MPDRNPLDEAVVERLDEHDLRYTSGRRLLVRGLRSATGPVTLPELLDLEPDLPQSSAYRNLALLEEAGIVRRLVHDASDHARFELAEPLTDHHHHLICDSCGVMVDVVFDDDIELALDRSLESMAASEGFTLRHHNIDLFGTCADCRA